MLYRCVLSSSVVPAPDVSLRGWSQAVIAKIVPSGDPVAESGTHWVRYEGENVLRVVRLSEARYSCADNAHYLSWVALARGGGRRARAR